jgi:phosphatidylglycerophosphatase A
MPKTEPSLKQPAIFLSTLGGIGYLPKAPGTWASLVTLAPVFLIQSYYRFPWFDSFLLSNFYSWNMGMHTS